MNEKSKKYMFQLTDSIEYEINSFKLQFDNCNNEDRLRLINRVRESLNWLEREVKLPMNNKRK